MLHSSQMGIQRNNTAFMCFGAINEFFLQTLLKANVLINFLARSWMRRLIQFSQALFIPKEILVPGNASITVTQITVTTIIVHNTTLCLCGTLDLPQNYTVCVAVAANKGGDTTTMTTAFLFLLNACLAVYITLCPLSKLGGLCGSINAA